jgi:hypothetical protein
MLSARAHYGVCGRSCHLTLAALLSFPSAAAAQARATIIGVVRDSAGAPVPEADVSIAALRLLTRTDDSGAFTLRRVQPGAPKIMVRRFGFRPRTLELTVRPGVVETVGVVLEPLPQELAGVLVTEREMRRQFAIDGFYRRRARGTGGVFVTREEIEGRHASRLSDVMRGMPGLRFVRTRSGSGIRFMTSAGQRRDCVPDVWVDGMRARGMEVDDFSVGDIEGVELYHGPSSTPLQFSSGAVKTCGTIVIWSRVPGT